MKGRGRPQAAPHPRAEPGHEIVTRLAARYEKDAGDPLVGDYAELIFGYATLAEGSELPDPARFNRLLAELMAHGA